MAGQIIKDDITTFWKTIEKECKLALRGPRASPVKYVRRILFKGELLHWHW